MARDLFAARAEYWAWDDPMPGVIAARQSAAVVLRHLRAIARRAMGSVFRP